MNKNTKKRLDALFSRGREERKESLSVRIPARQARLIKESKINASAVIEILLDEFFNDFSDLLNINANDAASTKKKVKVNTNESTK